MNIPIKKFINNAYIYLSGQAAPKEFYIIKSGQVKITKSNSFLGESEELRGVGYIFGVIQCLTGIAEDETAEAVIQTELFIIKKENIREVFINHKKVVLKILSEYSEILRKLDTDLINFNFFSDVVNRKENIFEIAKKYIQLKQEKNAAHLLKSICKEYSDDKVVLERAKGILSKLPEVKLIENKGIMYEDVVPPNSVIFTEFELAENFYIIKKGKVNITKLRHDKEVLLAILGEGDIFGEMAVLNDKPRNATALAVEETELMIISKTGIDKLPPQLIYKLLEFLSKRIWFVQQQLICYKLPITIAKIYFMLTSKVKQVLHNPEEESSESIVFKFPQKELYKMIDYDYERRGKEDIQEFLDDKNVEFFPDSIRIRNIGKLFDKNAYYFSRALIIYNSSMDNL